MARTVEAILGVVPRHCAAQMGALAVRGDDPARCVEKEEPPLAEEDRPIVRGGEHLQNLRFRSDGDRVSEPFDPADANEWSDQRRDLGRGEAERAEEAESEDRPPAPARDRVLGRSEPKHRQDLRTRTTTKA